jgi:hypothetical protein
MQLFCHLQRDKEISHLNVLVDVASSQFVLQHYQV